MSLYVDIEKNLGTFQLRAKFEAADETAALLGASGCGKSLTLKCIAGIEKPDRGKIVVDGVTLFDSEKRINLSPQARRTGLMFQNYALFPNMTVLKNIQAGAKRERNVDLRAHQVETVMESFGLTELAQRYPHQLSGGQQQRVALARILVSNPRILLLDEPFSALDSHLRFRLEREVRQVIRQFGKTVVLVSHDQDEVYRMADQIVIMDNGSIQATGPRETVFQSPQTTVGAILTGCKNISPIAHMGGGRVKALEWGITLQLPEVQPEITAIGIRMHDIRPGDGENSIRCRVAEEIENPFSYTVMLEAKQGAGLIGWKLTKEAWLQIRQPEIGIILPTESILLLQKERNANA